MTTRMDVHRPRTHLGLAVETWVTGGAADPGDPTTEAWSVDNLSAGIVKKGYAWEAYKAATIRRGALAADWDDKGDGTIEVRKTAVIPFLSLFDIVFLNHGAPPSFIKAVKELHDAHPRDGLHPAGHWVFQHAQDDYVTGLAYGGWSHTFWNGMVSPVMYFMKGTHANTEGSWCVDLDEGVAYGGGHSMKDIHPPASTQAPRPAEVAGHAWAMDYVKNNFGYATRLATLAEEQVRTYWDASAGFGACIDAFIHHDLFAFWNPRAGGAGATNKPTFSDDDWKTGSEKVLTEHARLLRNYDYLKTLWHACGSVVDNKDGTMRANRTLRNCRRWYYNYCLGHAWFTPEKLLETLSNGKADGNIEVIGNQNSGAYITTMTTANDSFWYDVHKHAASIYQAGNTYVSMVMEPGSPLFHHPALRPLT